MPRRSERPTAPPAFDIRQFARDSDRKMARAQPLPADNEFPPEREQPHSEVRRATRPSTGATTDETWARSVIGSPVVVLSANQLKRPPLDHPAGFVLSLMDGSIDLETLLELSLF